MPTETFTNLPREKKNAIFDSAVQEFAARPFSTASINQIVKNAGISRGSFYQYFADKEDLYLYVLAEIAKEKLQVIERVGKLHPDADFFETYRHWVESILAWARERPLYYKIGMLMEMDDSDLVAKLLARVPQAWAKLANLIRRDQERGRIRSDVDPDLVVDIIYAQNQHYFKEFYRTWSEEDLLRRIDNMLKIIKGGIANV